MEATALGIRPRQHRRRQRGRMDGCYGCKVIENVGQDDGQGEERGAERWRGG